MKKNFLMMLALMLTTSLTMMADNDRVINFEQLPAPAQALLKQLPRGPRTWKRTSRFQVLCQLIMTPVSVSPVANFMCGLASRSSFVME